LPIAAGEPDRAPAPRTGQLTVSVFGLGYVGCVTTGCLARQGYCVTGVDLNPLKVQLINDGKSPVVEPGLEPIIFDGVRQRRITATADVHQAIVGTDVSLVCVGTPSLPNGDLDLTAVRRVAQQIGTALRACPHRHTVVIR